MSDWLKGYCAGVFVMAVISALIMFVGSKI